MKVLLINGSPKGKGSNTIKLANSFTEGMAEAGVLELQLLDLSELSIGACRGCFACWNSSSGSCAIEDDMADCLRIYGEADCVIWSFPLYCYAMPAKLQAFMERLLPGVLPQIFKDETGSFRHPERFPGKEKRHVLVSSCGFCSLENNFEGLLRQFALFVKGPFTQILCAEGELFRVPEAAPLTIPYLDKLRQAGREYVEEGRVSESSERALAELLMPVPQFLEMANASWENGSETGAAGQGAE